MQSQGHFGILCRIGGCLIDRHLIKTELLLTLACDLFIGDVFMTQIFERQ